jgi:cysteine synthase A
MIEDAEREGKLRPGMRIIEASTGNTATALAFVGAVKGYPVTLYVPDTAASEERIRICKSYGAQVVKVDTQDEEGLKQRGIHGAVAELIPRQVCLQEEQNDPNTWWARQFSNPSNAVAHQETTAKEILEQTGGKVDAFVAAIGTGGTLVGVARALKAHNPAVKIVAVEPKNSRTIKNGRPNVPIIEGVSGGLLLQVAELADEVVAVSDDEAISMCHRLAQEEGLFCGISSGANVLVALRVARELGGGKRVVTVLVDSRDRYLFVERFTT